MTTTYINYKSLYNTYGRPITRALDLVIEGSRFVLELVTKLAPKSGAEGLLWNGVDAGAKVSFVDFLVAVKSLPFLYIRKPHASATPCSNVTQQTY